MVRGDESGRQAGKDGRWRGLSLVSIDILPIPLIEIVSKIIRIRSCSSIFVSIDANYLLVVGGLQIRFHG